MHICCTILFPLINSGWGWQNCWGNKLSPLIWYGKADDDDTSQHLLDPYSFDHMTSGIVQYMVFPPGGTGVSRFNDDTSTIWMWFGINIALHAFWEFCEVKYSTDQKSDMELFHSFISLIS